MKIDAKGLMNFICYRQFLLLPRTMYVVSSTQLLTMHDCESECEEAEQPPWGPWTTQSGHREWTKWGIESLSTRLKTHTPENKPYFYQNPLVFIPPHLCKYYLQTDKRLKQFRSTHLTMHPDCVSACTKFGAKHVTYMVRDISKQTDWVKKEALKTRLSNLLLSVGSHFGKK